MSGSLVGGVRWRTDAFVDRAQPDSKCRERAMSSQKVMNTWSRFIAPRGRMILVGRALVHGTRVGIAVRCVARAGGCLEAFLVDDRQVAADVADQPACLQ